MRVQADIRGKHMTLIAFALLIAALAEGVSRKLYHTRDQVNYNRHGRSR